MLNKSEFKIRPYNSADAPRIVEVINLVAALTVGAKQAVVDSVGNIRLTYYIPPISEKVVVINANDEIVGFAHLTNVEQAIIGRVGGTVHPNYWGRGIGSMLVDWAEGRGSTMAQQAPAGIRTVLQTTLYTAENEAIKLFAGRGFRKVREWAHLVIELDHQPLFPVLPDGLRIREMDLDEDWDIVGPAMDEAYAEHWGAITESFVASDSEAEGVEVPEDDSYSNGPGLCFIVLAGQAVIGGILCNRKLVERSDTGRVGSLFVRPSYQRQGVGRALMLAAFKAFWESGIKRIVTDTDADSFTHAPKFYASLGMTLYRREHLYEKEIRPGREVRRLGI